MKERYRRRRYFTFLHPLAAGGVGFIESPEDPRQSSGGSECGLLNGVHCSPPVARILLLWFRSDPPALLGALQPDSADSAGRVRFRSALFLESLGTLVNAFSSLSWRIPSSRTSQSSPLIASTRFAGWRHHRPLRSVPPCPPVPPPALPLPALPDPSSLPGCADPGLPTGPGCASQNRPEPAGRTASLVGLREPGRQAAPHLAFWSAQPRARAPSAVWPAPWTRTAAGRVELGSGSR